MSCCGNIILKMPSDPSKKPETDKTTVNVTTIQCKDFLNIEPKHSIMLAYRCLLALGQFHDAYLDELQFSCTETGWTQHTLSQPVKTTFCKIKQTAKQEENW